MKNFNKNLILISLFLIISTSIVLAAILSSKTKSNSKNQLDHKNLDDDSNNPFNLTNSINSNFNTYPQFIQNLNWLKRNYTHLVVFGASDCDNGRPRPAELNQTIRPPPYFQGRFTNGPVFAEYLSQSTLVGRNITLLDYAYGDATVTNQLINVNAPDTQTQIQTYLNDFSNHPNQLQFNHQNHQNHILHSIWIGVNDVIQIWNDVISNNTFQNQNFTNFNLAQSRIHSVVENLKNQIKSLKDNHQINQFPSDIIVILLAPMDIIPNLYYQSRDLAKHDPNLTSIYWNYAGNLTNIFNQALVQAVDSLSSSNDHSNNFLEIFDTVPYFYYIKNNPKKFNFDNVVDACWNSTSGAICKDPSKAMYWDTLHPSTAMHQYLAQEITVQCNRQN